MRPAHGCNEAALRVAGAAEAHRPVCLVRAMAHCAEERGRSGRGSVENDHPEVLLTCQLQVYRRDGGIPKKSEVCCADV